MDVSKRLRSVLRTVKLFSALDEESLSLLEAHARPVSFGANEFLCREGEPGDRMFIVDSGQVRVLKAGAEGISVEVALLGPGEVAGMMSLLESAPRSATMQAVGPTQLWELDSETFRRLIGRHSPLAWSLLELLSQYLRRETAVVAELLTRDTDQRLKVAVFDTKPYSRQVLEEQNEGRYALTFLESRLNADTVGLAEGFEAVCAFVNDDLSAEVVGKLGRLGVGMVAMRCAGFNNVDLAACVEAGISVARVPAYSPYAVAEHAVALMLALNRHIHRAHNRIREGNFSLDGLVGFDMHGKHVGVIGTGQIGKCLVNILVGMGCQVLAYDRYPDESLAQRQGVRYVELEELWANSDIISLHAPLTPETHHLVSRQTLAKMKPGVMLINTSRGGLIDTPALIDGLLSGRVGSAGLDVYEEESEYFFEDFSDSMIADETLARLTTFNNVMVTSHMAFLTREALVNIANTTLHNLAEYEDGKHGAELTNAVLPA